jgi:hypothetical protein
MVVIALSNVGEVSIERIANDLAAILFGKPYVLPKSGQIIEIDPAIYNAYVGDYTGAYEFAPGIILTISTESDRIRSNLYAVHWTRSHGDISNILYRIFPESARYPTHIYRK